MFVFRMKIMYRLKRFIEYMFKRKVWRVTFYDLFYYDEPRYESSYITKKVTEYQINKHIMKRNQERGKYVNISGSYMVYSEHYNTESEEA